MTRLFWDTARDLSQYREVLHQLLLRDLRERHKHTKLGILWSLLNPLLQFIVLSAVFSHMARLDIRDYRLYVFAGILPWMFIQSSWFVGSGAFIDNQPLLRRAYFPRLFFPVGRVLARLVDYVAGLFVFSVLALAMGYHFHASVLALPIAIVILFGFALGLAVLSAILSVFFRDVLHFQPIAAQIIYLATPIIYPLAALPPDYLKWAAYNPFYRIISLFQTILYAGELPSLQDWLVAGTMSLAAIWLGLWVMRRKENDVVFNV